MATMVRYGALVTVFFLTACGGSDPAGAKSTKKTAPAPDAGDPAAATDTDGPASDAGGTGGAEWKTIITGDWTLDPGTEKYVCVRKTLDEDMIVSAFEAIIPLGTHHTLLTVGDPQKADGVEPCTAADNYPLAIYGSGVGTNALKMPDGVAVRVQKGKQLLLNLHLFNTGVDPISGTSGTRVRLMNTAEVKDYAEGVLAGTINLNLPPHVQTTSTGYCTLSHDVTLFSVAPHMHQLGTHMKVVAMPASGAEVVLHDGPYDFNEQRYYQIDPLPLAKGDVVRVECTHTNTTDHLVKFGDSSLAEMCFAGLYMYPAADDLFACVGDAPP